MPHLYDNIPFLLKQRPNWVAWGVRDAPLKAPFNPTSLLSGRLSPAKAGIRDTWSNYQAAVDCVERGLAQGIGYEFDGGGDIYGVDLDHVISEFIRGHEVELLPKEFEILSLLLRHPGRVFTHERILNEVWGEEYIEETRHTLWSQINNLRKKIQIYSDLPDFIKTIRGVGYSFDPR